MTLLSSDISSARNLWVVLGHEQPRHVEECNRRDCHASQPWDIFCPVHEHLLFLGASSDSSRWKPRWFLAHFSRLGLVGVFVLAARWNSPIPLFALSVTVTTYVLYMVTRNYWLTRGALRYGFIMAAGIWTILRVIIPVRADHRSIDLVLSWAPLVACSTAAVILWHPTRIFFHEQLALNRASKLVAGGLLFSLTLLILAHTTNGRRQGLSWGIPHTATSRLRQLAPVSLTLALVAAFVSTWWASRVIVSEAIIADEPSPTEEIPDQIRWSDTTPTGLATTPQLSIGARISREVLALVGVLRTTLERTADFVLATAATIRHEIATAATIFAAARRFYLEALTNGILGALRCIAWLGLRVGVPLLAAVVSTAASWNFADNTTKYFRKPDPYTGVQLVLYAGFSALLALLAVFIAWTVVSGCERHNMARSAATATWIIAPRLLLVFTVGSIAVEIVSALFGLSPIRFGPLTFIATIFIVLLFFVDKYKRARQLSPQSTSQLDPNESSTSAGLEPLLDPARPPSAVQ